MYTLIIDTSTERGLVALSKGLNVLFKEELPFGILNSKILMTTVSALFQRFQIEPKDLRAISVSVGPGSFTGIRVGASAAVGISIGAKVPIVGFSSLSGFVSESEGPFISLIDAKIGGAYVLFQDNQKGRIFETSEPKILPLCHLPTNIPLIGPNFQRIKLPHSEEKYPDATHIAALTEAKLNQNQFSKEGHLELLYLRSTL